MPGREEDHRDERAETDAHLTQRLDRWLWFARVVKSRTLAAQLVQDGKVRINRAKAAKPAQVVRANDVLTLIVRGQVQVLKVLAPGERRGPPAEARLLYELLSPAVAGQQHPRAPGRPDKRERRLIGRLTDRADE